MRYTEKWTRGSLNTEKKQLIVAIDHGLSFPDMQGLERPVQLLKEIIALPGVDGLIATPGVYRQAQKLGIDLSGINKLVTMDCVKLSGTRLTEREVISSADEVMPYQPDCLKFFLNIYDDPKELMRNLKDVSKLANDAARLGVSTIAEIMFWNNDAFSDPAKKLQMLYEGCRMAMELGVDTLKIPNIGTTEQLNELIDKLGIPTFLLGGSRTSDVESFIQSVRAMRALHICGLMLGRNVWQSPNMADTIRQLQCALACD